MSVTHQTPTGLRARLEADLSAAEAADSSSTEAATLRLILCAVHDRDVEARASEERITCQEGVIRDVLSLMVRQRETSASSYEESGRIEMADTEREEIEIIERYLPAPMNDNQLEAAVASVITDLDANGLKDLGRCIDELKSRLPEDMNAGKAGKLVRKALTG